MPWAHHEPESLDAKVQRLRSFRAEFDLDRDYIYGIFDSDEIVVLGGTGLHKRIGEGAREIGYWIHQHHVGRGYATEAAAALTRVAFEVDLVRRVEIRCDPTNDRSIAVPRKLGFTHEGTLRKNSITPDGELRDTMIWSLIGGEYPRSSAAAAQIEAFGASGKQLL
jgi:RimJ/RimL family protein N-acetyltransferase